MPASLSPTATAPFVHVRFLNAIPWLENIDLYIDGDEIASHLGLGLHTPYTQYLSGHYHVAVHGRGFEEADSFLCGVEVVPKRNYTTIALVPTRNGTSCRSPPPPPAHTPALCSAAVTGALASRCPGC